MDHGLHQPQMLSDSELRDHCLGAIRRYHEQQQDMLVRHLAQLHDQLLRKQVQCQLDRVAEDTALRREQCKGQTSAAQSTCAQGLPAQTNGAQRDALCRIALDRAQVRFDARVSLSQQQRLHEMD